MKHVKVLTEELTKDAKLAEKTGKEHKISLSFPTKTTNVSTVQAVIEFILIS